MKLKVYCEIIMAMIQGKLDIELWVKQKEVKKSEAKQNTTAK